MVNRDDLSEETETGVAVSLASCNFWPEVLEKVFEKGDAARTSDIRINSRRHFP
jgi:hypothetical protein